MSALVWIEGIDFADFVYDTNQVQIVRGSSLGLLAHAQDAGKRLGAEIGPQRVETVMAGASMAILKVDGDMPIDPEALARSQVPCLPLRFAVGTAQGDDSPTVLNQAQAFARFAQISGGFVTGRAVGEGDRPRSAMCAMTKRMPADTTITLPADQAESLIPGGGPVPVSTSALARRRDGKRAVQRELANRATLTGYDEDHFTFVDNLQELSGTDDETKNNLPLSVRNRMAVIYLDGNSFSNIRNEMGGDGQALRDFSQAVDQVIYGRILRQILEYYQSDEPWKGALRQPPLRESQMDGDDDRADTRPRLRFDMLLCGGDDLCIVVPAWLALDVARIAFEAALDQTIVTKAGESKALAFKIGLAVADCKTPIVAMRALADSLSMREKRKDATTLFAWMLEGPDPPNEGADALWVALGGNDEAHCEKLAFDKPGFEFMLKTLTALKATIPRSQLYRALRAAAWSNDGSGARFLGLVREAAHDRAMAALRAYKGPQAESQAWKALLVEIEDRGQAGLDLFSLTAWWDYHQVCPRSESMSSREGVS